MTEHGDAMHMPCHVCEPKITRNGNEHDDYVLRCYVLRGWTMPFSIRFCCCSTGDGGSNGSGEVALRAHKDKRLSFAKSYEKLLKNSFASNWKWEWIKSFCVCVHCACAPCVVSVQSQHLSFVSRVDAQDVAKTKRKRKSFATSTAIDCPFREQCFVRFLNVERDDIEWQRTRRRPARRPAIIARIRNKSKSNGTPFVFCFVELKQWRRKRYCSFSARRSRNSFVRICEQRATSSEYSKKIMKKTFITKVWTFQFIVFCAWLPPTAQPAHKWRFSR